MTDTEIKNDLLYNELLINPIQGIITKLKDNQFRDCDIKWLNQKLKNYTNFALKTMDKSFELPDLDYEIMNEFVKNKFIEYFETLLSYFKSIW